ncbi:MAG: ATP-binding protein [Pseudomonadota bacterium]
MKGSLKKRLIWILLGLTLFAWISSALLTFSYAARVLLDQIDRQLQQYGDLVSYVTQIYARQIDKGVVETETWFDTELGTVLKIESPGGDDLQPALNVFLDDRLIAALEDSPYFDPPTRERFRFVNLGDSNWRVRNLYDAQAGIWIVVGIEIDAARWAMFNTLAQALFPLLIVLPLTIVVLWFGVSRGLRPLQDLASQISQRSPGALEPVATASVPIEMQAVVDELNELLDRLAFALDSEQRFTANAAHELRTPLAAIKTEVQLCQRQMAEAQEGNMLTRIGQRVDRASHSVEQLLILARVDPQAPLAGEPVVLDELVSEVVTDNAHLAADRDLEIDLQLVPGCTVKGREEMLAIMLRNLLVNAFRYATESSPVRVHLQPVSGGIELEVCNDCEPLSPDEFRQVTQRFYRVPGSAGLGAGLGLSIVTRIADQHGAEFSAAPLGNGRGFCARIVFPA